MTIKQKKAISLIVENGGNVSKAMRDAGYSAMTAKTPQKLTESTNFKQLIAKELDDVLVVRKHREALEATKWNDFTGERESDHTTRLKAVELTYKLKRYLGPETMTQINAGGDMTLEFTT